MMTTKLWHMLRLQQYLLLLLLVVVLRGEECDQKLEDRSRFNYHLSPYLLNYVRGEDETGWN